MKRITTLVAALALALSPMAVANATIATEDTTQSDTCIPSPAIPAVPGTPEIPSIPEVPAQPAVYETGWQRYSWTGGPHESDTAPAFPSADWQANVAGDPHGVGVPGAYFRSHGNSGNGDWFYLEATQTLVTPAKPAIPAVPGVPATPGSPAVPAVVCPDIPVPPTEEPPPTTPEPPVVVSEPPVVAPPVIVPPAPQGQPARTLAVPAAPAQPVVSQPTFTG